MLFLLDAARHSIEQHLGWAMLLVYSQCCRSIVTESIWQMLETLLEGPRTSGQGLGRHVGRLYGLLVGVVRHRANVPPEARFPMLSHRTGGFLRLEPLRRVRIEHATAWTEPIGPPGQWQDLRDVFLTRGFDEVLPRFHGDQPASTFVAWRQVIRKQLTAEIFAEVTVSTVRLLCTSNYWNKLSYFTSLQILLVKRPARGREARGVACNASTRDSKIARPCTERP